MLHYVVRCYTTLWDVMLRCEMLHYVVRRYATFWDVTLRFEMLRFVLRCYVTLWDVTLRWNTLRFQTESTKLFRSANNSIGQIILTMRYFVLLLFFWTNCPTVWPFGRTNCYLVGNWPMSARYFRLWPADHMQIEIVPRDSPRYDYILNGKLYHIDKNLDGICSHMESC